MLNRPEAVASTSPTTNPAAAIGRVPAAGRLSPRSFPIHPSLLAVLLSVSLLLVAAPRVRAQGFGLRTDFATGTAPRTVASGDLNGDGRPDLVTANSITNNVSVLLGAGGGSFGAKIDFATGAGPYGVAVGDINLDGKLDLVAANNAGSSVSVLLGDGLGGFPTRNDFATGTNARTVVIADLDGNGTPDLVTANSGTNNVSVLLGNGTGIAGGFARTDFATALFPFSVAVGDVNLDGRPDLAVTDENSAAVSVLLGTGGGAFGPKTDFTTGGTPHSVAIADLNRDGKLDLAVANQAVGTLSVLIGDGAGGFGPKTDFTTGSSPYALAVGDVDGNGRPDVVTANQGAASVSVLLGDGTGGLGAKTDFATGTQPQWVTMRDLNGDGRPDLAVANTTSNTVSVLLNAYPVPPAPLTFGHANFRTATGPFRAAIADLNLDGKLDLAAPALYSDVVSILLGTGSGSFGAKTDFATGHVPEYVAIQDWNGDGKPDLAISNTFGTTVSVLLGTGTGGFGAKTDFTTASGPGALASGDFNRDGHPDLAIVDYSSNFVSVMLGTGAGGFGPRTDFATGAGPVEVAVGDVNADGKLDLVIPNHDAGSISVLRGLGTGSFMAKSDFICGADPYEVALGDMNADGRLDYVVAVSGSNSASVFVGDGSGGFSSSHSQTTGVFPQAVAVGDLNRDGKLDVVTANYGDIGIRTNTISVLLGNGDGTLASKSDFPTENGPVSVTIGDVDREGRPDLIVANVVSHEISVLLNGYITIAASGFVGAISPAGAVPVAYGGNRTFSITGSTCNPISDVTVDGASVGSVTSYTFTNVTSDHTIAVTLDAVRDTVTATAGPGGVLTPSGVQSAQCGSSATFTITPDSCKRTLDVVIDGQSLGPITQVSFSPIQANHTISASFVPATSSTIFSPTSVPISCGSTGNRLCTLESYDASILGSNEVPPQSSAGSGSGVFTLDPSNSLLYDLRYYGLSSAETAAHLHGPAPPGVNAGLLSSLPLGNPVGGQVVLNSTQVTQLRGGQIYFNVHTSGFPSGEMRGQLTPRLSSHAWSVNSTDPGWMITGGQGTACITYTSGSTAGAVFKLVTTTPGGCRDSSTFSVTCGVVGIEPQAPSATAIGAIPNPLRGATRIDYALAVAGPMRLEVFSMSGQRVRTLVSGQHSAGSSSVLWNSRGDQGARLAAGAYVLRLTAPGKVVTRKFVLLR